MSRWLAIALLSAAACSEGEPAAPQIDPPEGGIAVENDAATAPVVCPRDLPKACPSPPPSYANEIEAVVRARCFPCHDSTGQEGATHDFSTYAKIHAQFGSILTQVYGCVMPPAASPPLTSDERAALLAWLVCGAPDN